MEKTTLVIMAAGIGSRFGGGIKQLTSFGASGELMIDFSIYDALAAGFDKVVFVIRPDLEEEFRRRIGDRIARVTEVTYVYQQRDALPGGFLCPPTRKKPWGTGQAILACKDVVDGPFAVINADDYYGKQAFSLLHQALVAPPAQSSLLDICMVAYTLRNTLSDFGSVTRGVCQVSGNGLLQRVEETYHIEKRGGDACQQQADGSWRMLDPDSPVSMNIWGFRPEIFPVLESEFVSFLQRNIDSEKAEFVLPIIVDGLIRSDRAQVRVLRTQDSWFGVTYQEDVPAVKEAFRRLIEQGVYPTSLF